MKYDEQHLQLLIEADDDDDEVGVIVEVIEELVLKEQSK